MSIARTLYYDADVVLFDDPLSAVDAHVGAHIFDQAIQGMLREKTVILATHALQYLSRADSVVVMEHGRIVEHDSFESLMASGSAFSRFAREYGVASPAGAASPSDVTHSEDHKESQEGREEQQAEKSKASSRPLMQKEDQATGSVSFATWRAYSKAADGVYTVPLVLLSLTLMSASQSEWTALIRDSSSR